MAALAFDQLRTLDLVRKVGGIVYWHRMTISWQQSSPFDIACIYSLKEPLYPVAMEEALSV